MERIRAMILFNKMASIDLQTIAFSHSAFSPFLGHPANICSLKMATPTKNSKDTKNNKDKNSTPKGGAGPGKPPVRRIPSAFESSTIANAEFVIAGTAERISATKLPMTEEIKPNAQKECDLRVRSDQPTILVLPKDDKSKVRLDKDQVMPFE